MDDCREQRFVGKDDDRAASVGTAIALLQPVVNVACLQIVCSRRQDSDVLLTAEVVVYLIALVECIREENEVLADFLACLVTVDIKLVVVPIEESVGFGFQPLEQFALYWQKMIETDENDVLYLFVGHYVARELLYGITIECTLVHATR